MLIAKCRHFHAQRSVTKQGCPTCERLSKVHLDTLITGVLPRRALHCIWKQSNALFVDILKAEGMYDDSPWGRNTDNPVYAQGSPTQASSRRGVGENQLASLESNPADLVTGWSRTTRNQQLLTTSGRKVDAEKLHSYAPKRTLQHWMRSFPLTPTFGTPN